MGQSVFSQLKRSTMRPFVAIAFILGSVYSAPSNLLPAGYAAGHLAAAPLAVAHAAPVAVAAAPAVSLPAPYSVDTQAEGVTTVHQPAPVVTKQVHYGQTSYVSGYNTAIHKPPTPPSRSPLSSREPTPSTPPLSRPRPRSTPSTSLSMLRDVLRSPMTFPSTRSRSSRSPTPSMLTSPMPSPTPSLSLESPSSRRPSLLPL